MVPNGWYPTQNTPGNAAMVAEYTKQYGGKAADVSSDVPEGYSVGEVTAQAVQKNGSLDQKKLISELHSGTFDSVQGKVKFDATGQNVDAFSYVFQWQNGQLVPYQPGANQMLEPVSPNKQAIEYPKKPW
jgi:branched-chain amino acid transport system substrate-binding protein